MVTVQKCEKLLATNSSYKFNLVYLSCEYFKTTNISIQNISHTFIIENSITHIQVSDITSKIFSLFKFL